MTKYHQGIYTPRYPEKWIVSKEGLGNGEIKFRSSWELRLMKWADMNSNIISVSSEPFPIQYYSEMDQKIRRYYIDFYVKTSDNRKILIEVKPHKETQPSKAKQKKRFIEESITYTRNCNKWDAARKFCQKHGMEFVIMDEYSLGIKKRK